jgi:hypothetical protein
MAEPLDLSSKLTQRAHELFQWLGSSIYSLKSALPNTAAKSEAGEPEAVRPLIGKRQIDPPTPQEQVHPILAAVASPIEPNPNLGALAGPVVPDSGCGPSVSTPSTRTSSILKRPGSDRATLKHFPKAIPTAAHNRFCDLRVLHGSALLEAVTKTKAQNISMKLKYLGHIEDTAKLYIVVQCDREIVSKVKRFRNTCSRTWGPTSWSMSEAALFSLSRAP